MNLEQSLALLAQGPAAWNQWATSVLQEKETLRRSGLWDEKELKPSGKASLNPRTKLWIENATVKFCDHKFVYDKETRRAATFVGLIFPGPAIFGMGEDFDNPATFEMTATFRDAVFFEHADFDGVKFSKGAYFSRAEFKKTSSFRDTEFSWNAIFNGTKFLEAANFNRATIGRRANFLGTSFHEQVDFTKIKVALEANFSEANFSDAAIFSQAEFSDEVKFPSIYFSGDAMFDGAQFLKASTFNIAQFCKLANFKGSYFGGSSDFASCQFGDDADFSATHFAELADFPHAQFLKAGKFDRVKFSDQAQFSMATFSEDASFNSCWFEDFANFYRVLFKGNCSFAAAHADSAFSLANTCFSYVPDFNQAHFQEAPRLDHAEIPMPSSICSQLYQLIRDRNRNFTLNQDLGARYRALKRIADQGHDHQRELQFFSGEVMARRGVEDFPVPWGRYSGQLARTETPRRPGCASVVRFWIGVSYQWLSNFGQSILRPLLLWGATTVLFAMLYVERYVATIMSSTDGFLNRLWIGLSTWPECISGQGGILVSAIGLALRRGLVIAGLESSDKINHIYACLYGVYGTAQTPGNLDYRFTPVIPDSVMFLGFAQALISAVLIFLFLLAVRNHFRVK